MFGTCCVRTLYLTSQPLKVRLVNVTAGLEANLQFMKKKIIVESEIAFCFYIRK